jgi:hypothetical protein
MEELDDRRIGGTDLAIEHLYLTLATVFVWYVTLIDPRFRVAVALGPIHRTSPITSRVEYRSCG